MAGDFRSAVFSWFDAKVENLTEGVKDALKETAEEGAANTRGFIETRGISKPGRIDTGEMRDSVNWAVDSESADDIQVSFGFKNGPFYTVFQELGTSTIAPMYALSDAAVEAENTVQKLVDDAIRKT